MANRNDNPLDLMKLSQREAERLQRAIEAADRPVNHRSDKES